jgi:polyhydroxybutyrate depolymerase
LPSPRDQRFHTVMPLPPGALVTLLVALAPIRRTGLAVAQTPEVRHTVTVNGESRSYLLFLPTAQPGRALPLVLVFHGGGVGARSMAAHTGFTRVAEREGFAVAYPEGLDHRWNDGRGYGASHDDVAFVRALLDSVERQATINSSRVYATGISNGAMFAYRLACELPGVLAAIAPVAGAVPSTLAERCASARPTAVAAFQGTADPLLPYGGGGRSPSGRGEVLSARQSVELWARVNGCVGAPSAEPTVDRVRDGTRVRPERWAGCLGTGDVTLYTIEGGGHTWPGGPPVGRRVGRVSRELDATTTIWAFFAAHARS